MNAAVPDACLGPVIELQVSRRLDTV